MAYRVIIGCLFIVAVSSGATLQQAQTAFFGGEVGPLLVGRSDLSQYQTGLRTAENALVIDVGAIMRRPGSYYAATSPGLGRFEPFVYDENDAYVLQWSHKKLRFYRTNGLITSGGSAYEVNTPYDGNDVFGLQFYQSADVCYIVHTSYSPRKLTRSGHTSWSLVDCNTLILDGPFRTQNTTDDVVQFSSEYGTATMSTTSKLFHTTHVGALWKADQVMATQTLSKHLGHDVTSVSIIDNHLDLDSDPKWVLNDPVRVSSTEDLPEPLVANTTYYVRSFIGTELQLSTTPSGGPINITSFGSGNITVWGGTLNPITGGVCEYSTSLVAGRGAPYEIAFSSSGFKGTVSIQVSYDNGTTWTDSYIATNPTWLSLDINDSQISDYGQNVLVRGAMTAETSGYVLCTGTVNSYVHRGLAQITGYTDANHVTVNILDRIADANSDTKMWSEGAWSGYRGYPQAVTGHFGRLVFAKDLTIWWSAAEDFENFYPGTNDDEAFSYTLSQARQNSIR